MASILTAYPDADLDHAERGTVPVAIDGSTYVRPAILGTSTAGYQGGDSNSDALVTAALSLPAIEGATTTSEIELVAKSEHHFATFSEATVTGTSITIAIPSTDVNGAPFTLLEDDLLVVSVWSQQAVSSDPGAPSSCTHSSLSFSSAYAIYHAVDWRPRSSAFRAFAAGGESGDITISWGSTNAYTGRLKIFRGVHTSDPFGGVSAVSSQGFDFPNPPSIIVAHQGSAVIVEAHGDAPSSGYATPVVSADYTELANSAKSNPNTRRPYADCALYGCSPGSYDPPVYSGLNYGNESSVVYTLRPAPATTVPMLVVVASSDETATVALSSGDVTLTPIDEIQILRNYLVGSGTRTLTFSGQTTGSVSYNATAAQVQTALEALSNVAPGDVACTGGPLDVSPVTIAFSGAYALTNVPTITVSSSNVVAVDEVQSIQSVLSSGTFTLTFGGQTTAALPYSASASQVQSALEALSSIGTNNVVCSGGPLNSSSVLVRFTSAEGGQPQSLITTSTGSVAVSEITNGVAGSGMTVEVLSDGSPGEDFALLDSWNIPRSNSDEPQFNVFSLLATSYVVGTPIDVTVSSHDGIHSWAAYLIVGDFLDGATPWQVGGSETSSGGSTQATFGTITPSEAGALVLAFLAKAKPAAQYGGAPPVASAPLGTIAQGTAAADAMTLDAFLSASVPSSPYRPGNSQWSGTEAYATGLVALIPASPASAGSDLYAAIDDENTEDYIDIANAAGTLYEAYELDLSALPASAVITSAYLEVEHECAVSNSLRISLAGVDSGGSLHLATEHQPGYIPTPLSTPQIVTTDSWSEFADGSDITEYSRLAVVLSSSTRHPQLASHKVNWARAVVTYEEGGPVVSDVSGPSAPGNPITWAFLSDSGFAQAFYQVRIIAGGGQNPDTATAPASVLGATTGQIIYDSGKVADTVARSLLIGDMPLGRGTCTAAVRAFSRLPTGQLIPSDWDTADFNIPGSPAAAGTQSTAPLLDLPSGAVSVAVQAPAGVSRAWLERSTDSGATWSLAQGGPWLVSPSASALLKDYRAPLCAPALRYRVSFDAGVMSESSSPVAISSGNISTYTSDWYFIVPSAPELSMRIDVDSQSRSTPRRVVSVSAAGGSATARSRPLATVMDLTIRTLTAAERDNLQAVLTQTEPIRVVDIFGDEWMMVPTGETAEAIRARPLPSEGTGIRDFFMTRVELVEVRA